MTSSVLPAILLFIFVIQTFVTAAPPGTSDKNKSWKEQLNEEGLRKVAENLANKNREAQNKIFVKKLIEVRNVKTAKEESTFALMVGSIGHKGNPTSNILMKATTHENGKKLKEPKVFTLRC